MGCWLERVKEVHDLLIIDYYETGRRVMLGKTTEVMVKHAECYLVSVLLHFKQNPHINKGLTFIAVMRPLSVAEEYIRVKPDGKIDGMTRQLIQAFEMTNEELENLSVYAISKDLKKVINAFNLTAANYLSNKIQHSELYFEEFEEPLPNLNQENKLTETQVVKSEVEIRSRRSLMNSDTTKYIKSRSRNSKALDITLSIESESKLGIPLLSTQAKELFEKFSETEQEFIFYAKHKYIRCLIKLNIEYYYDTWAIIIQIHDMIVEDRSTATLTKVELATPLSRNDRMATANTIFCDLLLGYEYTNPSKSLKQVKFMEDSKPCTLNELKNGVTDMHGSASNDSCEFPNEDEDAQILDLDKYVISARGNTNSTSLNPPPKLLSKKMILSKFASSNQRHLQDSINFKQENPLTVKRNSSPYLFPSKEGITLHDKINEAASSIGSSMTSKQITIHKMLEEALAAKYNKKKFTVFTWVFIIIIITIQILILEQGIGMISMQKEIKTHSNIVQDAYNRLDYLVSVNSYTNAAKISISGVVDSSLGAIMYVTLIPIVQEYLEKLMQWNIKLSKDIEGLSDPGQKREFFERSIKMYDNDASGLTSTYTLDDSFQAINKILVRAQKYSSNLTPIIPSINLDMEYVIWNSLNDLVVACEKSVELMQSSLRSELDSNHTTLKIVTGTSLGILFMIFLYTLHIFLEMNQETKNFAQCLASVKEEEAKYCLQMVQIFIRHLKQDFQNGDFREESRLRKKLAQTKDSVNHSNKNRKNIRFKGSFTRNFLLIIRLWPALLILGATQIYNFIYANNVISSISALHEQITAAAKAVYNIDLLTSANYEIITKQANSTIKNKPILEETYQILESLSDVDSLVSVFRDKDGKLTPSQDRFIYSGLECTDPFFDFLSKNCKTITQGKASIATLLAKFDTEMVNFLDEYLKSDRSLQQIPTFMIKNVNIVGSLTLVLSHLFRGLWSSTDDKLTEYMNNEEQRIETMISVTTVLIVLIVLLGLPRALKRVYNKENQLKSILKLVPLSIILKNKVLKSYLIRTSGKLGWSVIQAE